MQPSPEDVPTSQPSSFGEHQQGAPDAPEESNPDGHDSFNPPDIPMEAEGTAPGPAPAQRKTRAAPGSAAVTDAKFLADEFGVKEYRAAALVAEGRQRPEDAGSIEARLHKARRDDDPVANVPTPAEPKHDLVADSDEESLKPVLHVSNDRVDGG